MSKDNSTHQPGETQHVEGTVTEAPSVTPTQDASTEQDKPVSVNPSASLTQEEQSEDKSVTSSQDSSGQQKSEKGPSDQEISSTEDSSGTQVEDESTTEQESPVSDIPQKDLASPKKVNPDLYREDLQGVVKKVKLDEIDFEKAQFLRNLNLDRLLRVTTAIATDGIMLEPPFCDKNMVFGSGRHRLQAVKLLYLTQEERVGLVKSWFPEPEDQGEKDLYNKQIVCFHMIDPSKFHANHKDRKIDVLVLEDLDANGNDKDQVTFFRLKCSDNVSSHENEDLVSIRQTMLEWLDVEEGVGRSGGKKFVNQYVHTFTQAHQRRISRAIKEANEKQTSKSEGTSVQVPLKNRFSQAKCCLNKAIAAVEKGEDASQLTDEVKTILGLAKKLQELLNKDNPDNGSEASS